MNQKNANNIFRSSFNWVSSTVKKYLWNSNTSEERQTIEDIRFSLLKKNKQQAKKIVLDKLRKSNSKVKFNLHLTKIIQFRNDEVQFQKPQELVCPICIDIFIKPVVTICGHTFCYQCLDQALLFNSNCPVCRTLIRGLNIIKCLSLEQIIINYLDKFKNSTYKTIHEEKMRQYQFWIEKRTLSDTLLSVGSYIDVKDTQSIWCKAIINQIYRKGNNIQSILIHYIGWNAIYDEIINIQSPRLANFRFYSSRLDIPHYYFNTDSQDNMHSYVMIGEPYIPNLEILQFQPNSISLDITEQASNDNSNHQVFQINPYNRLNMFREEEEEEEIFDQRRFRSYEDRVIEQHFSQSEYSFGDSDKNSYLALNELINDFIQLKQQQSVENYSEGNGEKMYSNPQVILEEQNKKQNQLIQRQYQSGD